MSLTSAVGDLKKMTGSSQQVGWMCDPVAFFLYGLVKLMCPQLVIQTGHLWGKSAAVICEALADGAVLEEDGQRGDPEFAAFMDGAQLRQGPWQVVSVDQGPPVPDWQAGVSWLAQRYGPSFRFVRAGTGPFFRSPSWQELTAQFAGQRVLAVLDADHTWEGARLELDAVSALRPVIFLDDTRWVPFLGVVAGDFAAGHDYAVTEFPWHNGIALLTPRELA